MGLYVHAQLSCNVAGNNVELHLRGFVDPALKREASHVNNVDDEERQTEHNSSQNLDFLGISEVQTGRYDCGGPDEN